MTDNTQWAIQCIETKKFMCSSASKEADAARDEDGLVPLSYANLYSVESGAKRGMKSISETMNYHRSLSDEPPLTWQVVPVTVQLKK